LPAASRALRDTTAVLFRASCPPPLRGHRLRRCSLRLPASASSPCCLKPLGHLSKTWSMQDCAFAQCGSLSGTWRWTN